jgi:hypothetical protein
MIVRREWFAGMGGFPEDWRIGEDTVAHARMTAAGRMPIFEPEIIVLHHNLGGAGHLVRHLFHYGRYSARVRREYPSLPGGSAVRWPVLAIGMYAARTAQITSRVMASKDAPKLQFAVHFPGILIGLAAWTSGFVREAFQPNFIAKDY